MTAALQSALQSALTALIVAGSTGYACWALMPSTWRAAVYRKLGRTPAPAGGCSGCGGGCAPSSDPSAAPGTVAAPRSAVITVHRRPKVG
jgi:hypothetical protein